MSDIKLAIKDANNALVQPLVHDNGDGSITPYHAEDSTQRAALIAAIGAPLSGDASFVPTWTPNTPISTNGYGNVVIGVDAIDANASITVSLQLGASTMQHVVLPIDLSSNCPVQPISAVGVYVVAAAGIVTYQLTGGAATVNALLKR